MSSAPASTQDETAAPSPPAPADEGPHDPGPEPLWNESWYFDAISDDGALGVYHRIGRLPNQGVSLIATCVVRPGEPAITLVERAALPDGSDPRQAVASEMVRAEHSCRKPLESFSITVGGTGEAHADHSAPLRGERGEPIGIGLELSWESDGVPYMWRRSSRYEIPCRVSGSVRIGGRTHQLEGPGQRDHSWGARDWWGSDWVWSALHLDDGTHAHSVSVPDHPGFGVGYTQRDGRLTEAERVRSQEQLSDDGLISAGSIAISPPGLEVELEPLAFGALRLEAADGRVSHFPRAMCRLDAGDGRRGFGWVEWNRNQRPERRPNPEPEQETSR